MNGLDKVVFGIMFVRIGNIVSLADSPNEVNDKVLRVMFRGVQFGNYGFDYKHHMNALTWRQYYPY